MRKVNEICPLCGKDVCNGVGPEGAPVINWLLARLKSSELFFECAQQHDMDYHLQIGRLYADQNFLYNMIKVTDSLGWFRKRFHKISAYRNYYFVRAFGKGPYERAACSKLKEGNV